MSKNNNQFKIGHAFPGLCSLCHHEIAEFNGSHSNGKPIVVKIKPNFRKAEVILDDGSHMTVALCDECFDSIGPESMQELMESEINGWNHDVKVSLRDKWSKDEKDRYLAYYSSRYITNRADKPFTIDEVTRIKKPRISKLNFKVPKLKGAVSHGVNN